MFAPKLSDEIARLDDDLQSFLKLTLLILNETIGQSLRQSLHHRIVIFLL